MNVITTGGNWCYHDQLDGLDLLHNEALKIEWPDRSISIEAILIEEGYSTVSDMGHPCTITTKKAYVPRSINGAEVRIYLKGWKAERCFPVRKDI